MDSEANAERANQLAELLQCLADAIKGAHRPASECLLRFWSVWRWEKGDAETRLFRECFAKELVKLSQHSQIVPTLDASKATSLSEQPLFHFSDVPQPVRDELVEAGFRIEADIGSGPTPTVLVNGRILLPGFVQAFRHACQFVQIHRDPDWVHVNWARIGETCKKTPWLATHPVILNAIAESASEDARKASVAG